jgi:hypothetical protein
MCGKKIGRASYLNYYKYLGFFQNSSLSSSFPTIDHPADSRPDAVPGRLAEAIPGR